MANIDQQCLESCESLFDSAKHCEENGQRTWNHIVDLKMLKNYKRGPKAGVLANQLNAKLQSGGAWSLLTLVGLDLWPSAGDWENMHNSIALMILQNNFRPYQVYLAHANNMCNMADSIEGCCSDKSPLPPSVESPAPGGSQKPGTGGSGPSEYFKSEPI